MRALVESTGLAARIDVASAGTADYHSGELPDRRARAAARVRGIELVSRARQFTRADYDRYDYVLAMDIDNLARLEAGSPSRARARIGLLRDFDPGSPARSSVPDPYYGAADGFEQVLDLCEAACAGLLAHIRREFGW